MRDERVISWRAEMSDDQRECYQLLIDLFCGDHHIHGPVRTFGNGIKHSMRGSLSTFDFDKLTRLVVMAHDRCIRVEIVSSAPGRLGLELFKRHHRDGCMSQRHPTMEQAIVAIRPAQNEGSDNG